MARNKKLTDELAVLRVSTRDLQDQLESLRGELSTTKKELDKSRGLSTTLENDLLRVQEEAANAFPSSAMSVAGTYTSRYPHSARRSGAVSPTSSIISGFDQSTASANTMEAIRAGEAVGGGSGLLPMIQAQRDRFKKKNAELEEELSKMYSTVKSLRQEVSTLQKDNLSLYEKTRYVSTYNRGQGASTSASSFANAPSSASIYSSGDAPDRYQSAYEARISPFAQFRGRESTRAYKRMTLPERIVFSLTRIILANRTSRNLFAGYCFALHILLFVILYMMSTTEIEKHSAMSAVGSAAAAAYGSSGGTGFGNSGSGSGQLHGDDWQQEGFNQAS
jgi:homeobox protein cut-like